MDNDRLVEEVALKLGEGSLIELAEDLGVQTGEIRVIRQGIREAETIERIKEVLVGCPEGGPLFLSGTKRYIELCRGSLKDLLNALAFINEGGEERAAGLVERACAESCRSLEDAWLLFNESGTGSRLSRLAIEMIIGFATDLKDLRPVMTEARYNKRTSRVLYAKWRQISALEIAAARTYRQALKAITRTPQGSLELKLATDHCLSFCTTSKKVRGFYEACDKHHLGNYPIKMARRKMAELVRRRAKKR